MDASYTGKHNRALLHFRAFACLLLTGNALFNLLESPSYLEQVIYLTSIGFHSSYLYFLLSVQHYLLRNYLPAVRKNTFSLAHLIQVIYEVSFSLALPITVMFWSGLAMGMVSQEPHRTPVLTQPCP